MNERGPMEVGCPRLVAVSDEARLADPAAIARIEALARAGCPAILLRPGAMGGRAFYELAREARAICAAHGAELWIGDRADVARAAGADRVQLPARGLSLAGARRATGHGIPLGRSVHSAAEAARAAREGADHVIVGPIFATASHPGAAPAGVALLAEAGAAMAEARAEASPGEPQPRETPILAVGGMTPERVAAVTASGAWGVAAIAALWDAPDPAIAVGAFLKAFGGEPPRRALH